MINIVSNQSIIATYDNDMGWSGNPNQVQVLIETFGKQTEDQYLRTICGSYLFAQKSKQTLMQTIKHLIGQHDQKTHGGLKGTLLSIRENIVQKAQEVLDDWKPNEDGFDELFGSGGACDEIARVMSDVITEQIPDAEIFDGGQDGDDHAFIYVKQNNKAFAVDIPPGVYETGGGYNWKKKEGVKLEPDDVVIYEIDASVLESEFDDHDYD